MSDLSSLIARLEKAEGPSVELDYLLSEEFRGTRLGAPDYTASIDDAVSLAERVLPGHQVNVSKFTSTVARASIGNGWLAASNHKTPALAICLATLRALDQKGGTE